MLSVLPLWRNSIPNSQHRQHKSPPQKQEHLVKSQASSSLHSNASLLSAAPDNPHKRSGPFRPVLRPKVGKARAKPTVFRCDHANCTQPPPVPPRHPLLPSEQAPTSSLILTFSLSALAVRVKLGIFLVLFLCQSRSRACMLAFLGDPFEKSALLPGQRMPCPCGPQFLRLVS